MKVENSIKMDSTVSKNPIILITNERLKFFMPFYSSVSRELFNKSVK